MTIHFDVERLRNEILHLVNLYPELEEDGVLKADMIEGSTSFNDVMDHCLRKMREAVSMANAAHDEIEALERRHVRFEQRSMNLRALMFKLMDIAGQKKVERPRGTVSIANGRPKVIITDENQLPEQFVRIKKEPDKRLIESHLKTGESVPGAALSNAEPYLRIG